MREESGMETRTRRQTTVRWTVYAAGMVILALGLTLNTKAGLGVSPMLAVPYGISEIFSMNFGDAAFLMYCVYITGQLLLRGRKSRWFDLLQLPVSLLFSRVLNLFGAVITYNAAVSPLWSKLAVLAMAHVLTAIGVSLSVNMRLIPNPGDGIVQALSDRTGWELGLCKNLTDGTCFLLAVSMCMLTIRRVIGIGIGTVLSMVVVGRVLAVVNGLLKERMCRAAGVEY